MLIVLGSLCVVLAAIFALLALIQKQPLHQPTWTLCFALAGGGGILLLIRGLLGLSKKIRRRKSRMMPVPPEPVTGGEDGMVLILVLVLLGAISALLLHIQYTARIAQQADLRLWQDARLRAALNEEAFHLMQTLANDEDLTVDHLNQSLLETRETVRPDGVTTISRITDVNRYVDINNLVLGDDFGMVNHTERFLIEAMTKTSDFTPIERIEALTDWMDADDEGIRESEFYMALDPPYTVPNTWLHSWNELLLIHGFSPDYFVQKPKHVIGRPFTANMADLLTIVPGPRTRPVPVNINTASSDVLESVFGLAEEALARYIYIARADRPFRSIDALLAQANSALFTELAPFIAVRSTHFIIEVMAFEGDRRGGLRAVVHREPEGRVRVMQWVL